MVVAILEIMFVCHEPKKGFRLLRIKAHLYWEAKIECNHTAQAGRAYIRSIVEFTPLKSTAAITRELSLEPVIRNETETRRGKLMMAKRGSVASQEMQL